MKRRSKLRASASASAIAAVAALGLTATAETTQAQTVERTGTGQVLIFPYYTVNDDWVTTINVTNTSDSTLAVKFRLRESKNSRDVLDFTVVFSPYDVWTAWLQQDPDTGATQIFTNDNSCTSPVKSVVNGATANPIAYSGSQADGGGSGLGRLRDGYVEMLVMGEAPVVDITAANGGYTQGTVPYNAWHINGIPEDCAAVDSAFIATDVWDQTSDLTGRNGTPDAALDFAAPTSNPLKGNVSWLKLGTGAGAGSTALAVSDWAQGNLVTAQEFPWFLEPTFVTNATPWSLNTAALTTFEDAINVESAFNEWASVTSTGAVTEWVLTFPTKAYHVDKFNDQIQAAVSKYRNNLTDVVTCTSDALSDRGTCTDDGVVPLAPFTNLFSVLTNGVEPLGDSPVLVTYTFFDREEEGVETTTGDTSISPAPPPEIQEAALRYEANVVQFGPSSALGSNKAAIIDDTLLPVGAVNGWGKVTFGADPTAPVPLPAVGFAVKVRDQGDPGSAYGQAMDHGYSIPAAAAAN